MKPSFIFSSNSVRLSWKGWIITAAFLMVIFYSSTMIWPKLEQFNPSADYRLPYQMSSDYWMFERWSKLACRDYPAVIIGDSVIWGQYVRMDQTLSHCLDEGDSLFANLGVDGTHPAAILGLIKYYGKAITRKKVILHLNPLWMSSQRHDLSGHEEFRFNHPRLVPQFFSRPDCYNASFSNRMGIIMERHNDFYSLMNHVKAIYFENLDLQNWTMENPYKNPVRSVNFQLPAPENKPKSNPVSWTERGMTSQDFTWVQPGDSYQWSSFKKALKILKARENSVFVTIGPFNTYMLTENSLKRYNSLKSEVETWLQGEKIPYESFPELPIDEYADASHPLSSGYTRLAAGLLENDSFNEWIRAVRRE